MTLPERALAAQIANQCNSAFLRGAATETGALRFAIGLVQGLLDELEPPMVDYDRYAMYPYYQEGVHLWYTLSDSSSKEILEGIICQYREKQGLLQIASLHDPTERKWYRTVDVRVVDYEPANAVSS